MEQLLLHLLGDYCLQSHWMAKNKTSRSWPALVHASVYAAPFGLFVWFAHASYLAWFVIWATHFLIDRFRLARYVVWAKNWLGPIGRLETRGEGIARARDLGIVSLSPTWERDEAGKFLDWHDKNRLTIQATPSWSVCSVTGNPPDVPIWLATWLMIIADNTMHLCINWAALRWL